MGTPPAEVIHSLPAVIRVLAPILCLSVGEEGRMTTSCVELDKTVRNRLFNSMLQIIQTTCLKLEKVVCDMISYVE